MQLKINSVRARITVLWQHAQNHEVIMLESTAPVETIKWELRREIKLIFKRDHNSYCSNLHDVHAHLRVIYINTHGQYCFQGTHSSAVGLRCASVCVVSPADSQQSITFCFAMYVCICHIFTLLTIYILFGYVCVFVCVIARAGECMCVSTGDALTIPTPYSASVSSASGAAYIRTGQK